MSYSQAMKWHKKHPRGIPNLYFGFASSDKPKQKTTQELANDYVKYLKFHKKNETPESEIVNLDTYIEQRTRSGD